MQGSTNGETPPWLNIAAVIGLFAFITLGVLAYRHFSSTEKQELASNSILSPEGGQPPIDLKLVRPGEQPGRIVFADPDIADAEQFRTLAERDPKLAASVVAQMADDPTRDERMYDLMQIWVAKDPGQAAEWVVSLPFGSMKNHATTELGLSWGRSDPVAASHWVNENIFTENAPAGAASLTSAWADSDVEAATEWVESLDTDTPARSQAINALAFHLGGKDPQRGLAWLARLKPEDRNLIAVNFAASWSNTDPRSAANWLRFQASDLDPRTRDQASLTVIHSWTASEDGAANASKWIDDIPDGNLKENAKATFAETHSETSPAEALPWARDIIDPERRLEVTMVVFEEWIKENKESFRTEITSGWENYDQDLREEIYDLLLDEDPEFKKELIGLYENRGDTEDE